MYKDDRVAVKLRLLKQFCELGEMVENSFLSVFVMSLLRIFVIYFEYIFILLTVQEYC